MVEFDPHKAFPVPHLKPVGHLGEMPQVSIDPVLALPA
jgi:hypothetical protein